MATPLIRRPEGNGVSSQLVLTEAGPAEYYLPASRRGILNQKFPIADPMSSSSSCAGRVLIFLTVVGLAAVALRVSLFTYARTRLTRRPAR